VKQDIKAAEEEMSQAVDDPEHMDRVLQRMSDLQEKGRTFVSLNHAGENF
jgi:ABC-type histidine transport system ATPase subunit